MNDYMLLKWIHILSSTVLFGTGVGSAFYLLMASLKRDPVVLAQVARWVVIADWMFTATTVVIQPVTGLYMAKLVGMDLSARWLSASMVLYALAVACWLPVVWLQVRMRDIASAAAREGVALPSSYQRYFVAWVVLGIPAFFAFVTIFYLMTAKPA
jgi:uncharacterized membrane protein